MKKMVKFTSLILSLVLILSMVPGVAFAATVESPVQEAEFSPRAAYAECPQCRQRTYRAINYTNVDLGYHMVDGCPFVPNIEHSHHYRGSYTLYLCDSCGYSVKKNYKITYDECMD